ncbi:lantibiotic dehydratase [Streptomyces sp. NPDC088354]|uniref:lantibiotic dehydratase n=1 Tax=Streptomyces sp. NPDC088354 TaxID=3365856 RepID=UPI00381FACD3
MVFEAGPLFGVRVAAIATEYVEALCFSRTWARVTEILHLSDQVATEASRLADALHPVIGSRPGSPLRPHLVALRRDLFRAQLSPPRLWSPQVRATLPAPLEVSVTAWRDLRGRLSDLEATVAPLFAGEVVERTEALRAAAALDAFRQGVGQSSTSLSHHLDRWLATPDGTAPERRVLLRLAKYVARAAMKTSPYATFTASGLGQWTHTNEAASFAETLRIDGVVEVDRRYLNGLWASLATWPTARDAVKLRVNPSATREGNHIWFLGEGTSEPINCLPYGPGLRRVLEAVSSAPGGTRANVIAKLTTKHADITESQQAEQFLDALLDSGLVERCRPYTDRSLHATGDLLDWVSKHAPDNPLLTRLQELDTSTRSYAHCTTGNRLDWRRNAPRLSSDDAAISGHLLHESAVLPDPVVKLSRPALRQICEDLSVVCDVYALYDPSLPAKLAATDLFRALHDDGVSVPFLRFYRELHDPAVLAGHPTVERFLHRRPSPLDTDGDTSHQLGPRLTELLQLRRQTRETLNAYGTNPVPRAAARELITNRPSYVGVSGPVCCYGQLAGKPDAPIFVSNMIVTGPNTGIGRIQHLLGSPAAELAAQPDLAEFRTDADSNINLRPQVLRGIDYPHGACSVPPGVRLADLNVAYHADSGLLRLHTPDGTLVRPVHRGLMTLSFLPPAQALMIQVFGVHPAALGNSWALRDRNQVLAQDTIVHRPRLVIGSVTVARESWRMPTSSFPQPGRAEGDARYLLRLARWLKMQHLPRRFFARIIDEGGRLGPHGKSFKPVFVDAASWFLLQSLIRSLRQGDGTLILEEVFPETTHAPLYGVDGAHVTELVLDLARRPG